ncbi:MAG: PAS domain-containing protein, partial [Stellaceae bacterium]
LLIYLERDLQRQLLALFHYALDPGGHLFLGSAETAEARPDLFAAEDREHRIYAAKPRGSNAIELLNRLPHEYRRDMPTARTGAGRRERSPGAAHLVTLEATAPPSALVDEEHRIVNLSPRAGRFIAPPEGPLSQELPDLVRPELRAELRSALHRAFSSREPTITHPMIVAFNGNRHRVVVYVAPAPEEPHTAQQALVLFMDAGTVSGHQKLDEDDVALGAPEVRRLREELRSTQESLSASRREHESSIQELRIANEELQSVNEEYRSTAEELETSKEELQSINEELQTVNSELKTKLENVASAHSDLQNLVNATEIGTLFLDPDLRIKMLTPAVEQLFSVTDSDVGRPIADFTHKLAYDGVETVARAVLRNLAPSETEVRTTDGRWLMMRLRPYRTIEDRIEGVVVSFVDISERLKAEDSLRQSEERYRAMFEKTQAEAEKARSEKKTLEKERNRLL